MDVIMEPGHALSREIAAGEGAEAQIDAFIARRDTERRKSSGDQATEDFWKAAEQREDAHRRRENAAGWRVWHEHRAGLYARLSDEHAERAEALAGDGAA